MVCLQMFQEIGDLLVREVAVFRFIPHRIQQAPNVHSVGCTSGCAVLVATLEEKKYNK